MQIYQVVAKIACLVHQSLAWLTPTYLTTDIHLVSEYGRHPLRSSTDRTLTVPQTHNRFRDRSFAVTGPRLWNSLPISLQQISSYRQFRRYLKNHLFGIWEITAQCDEWFSVLCKYSYLLTYLLKHRGMPSQIYTGVNYQEIAYLHKKVANLVTNQGEQKVISLPKVMHYH